MHRFPSFPLSVLALTLAAPVPAVELSLPQPLPIERQIPAARDIAYPGTIELTVDATDVARGVFRIREQIPVAGAGRLYLLYPQWLPGNHGPSGPINSLAGLRITANGRPVEWRRGLCSTKKSHYLNVLG